MCGAVLGTVAGWQYDDDYSPDHRTYRAPGYYKILVPKKKIGLEGRWEYYIEFRVTVYLCDTNALEQPLVTRRIGNMNNPIKVREIREGEHAGGLDRWVYNVTTKEGEELLSRSNTETAGLVPCECEQLGGLSYNIEIFKQEEIAPVEEIEKIPEKVPEEVPEKVVEEVKPKVPSFVLGEIEYLEDRYKASEDIDEKMAIREEIENIKSRYGIK